ncbi:FadR/GntR family transcriptional regulator [Saccharopolyspora gregorii]|uniref:FadR/GntR family transcriptional regulator n=1 Tax=Saccharopolyspora gregorii TaxID=33914 RepID=UPI0021ACAA96|nr:FadR/GntR family transcriptional regulator [Saccharopolyspora gregorii]
MTVRTLQRTSLPGQVIAQVQDLIRRGEWPVGTKLPPETQLARDMGVGHSTVREALRAMAHFGMLETRPGSGTFVRADSDLAASLSRRISADALKGLEARNSLERDAARLATLRRTDDDLAALREHLHAQHAAYDDGDADRYAEADVEFHRALVAAAHNSVLDELYAGLTVVLRRTIGSAVAELQHEHSHLHASHVDLVDAVERRDATAADRAVGEHLALAEDLFRRS